MKPTALVLGAGLQGVCAGIALVTRGYRVTIVDQATGSMSRASGRTEGKIHLGFVYANDASFRTSSLMLDASLAFAPLLESWLGAAPDWAAMRSRPFLYAAMHDSLLPFDELCAFYSRLESAYEERIGAGHYLGARPASLWRTVATKDAPSWLDTSQIAGLVQTAEIALDPSKLRRHLTGWMSEAEDLTTLFGTRVESAERTPAGFRATGTTASGEVWRQEADILVNCLWDGRLKLDGSMGIRPDRSWVYRLKYRVMGELPARLSNIDSITFVLGPYGDIVTRPNTPAAYMSWYPACMQGWSNEIAPPAGWDEATAGQPPRAATETIARETLSALDRIVPGVASARAREVDAGVIVSWGQPYVDVDERASELHERHAVGVHAHDGYFSIDTGKFTCAPLFASHLLDALT